ncbi:MAG: substrate-binding domain-containing protein, partial [Deltaproteobacteria bacterium]|nr:substrate-binding domain-containing protein [Deltaproteobacteria bacterium]
MRTLRFLVLTALLALPSAAFAADELMMATTTSTQDSGLLDYLKPIFLKETGIDLKWVSTGTGKALEHGKNCDVDVLLVHAPAAELKMVEEGFAVDRRQIMYNDFVIIGPKN